jgi:tetratricopeptide (TPR) repeat protein
VFIRGSVVLLSLSAFVSRGLMGAPLDQPVGVMLSSGGSRILRAGTETPLASEAGDLLFVGDELRTKDAPASFLFCPGKAIERLLPGGSVQLQSKRFRLVQGKTSEQPVRGCDLPQVVHLAAASQQHYGITMIRGGPVDFPPLPREQLPASVLADLAPIEAALQLDANDPAALLAAANLFDRTKLYANELAEYSRMRQLWPDAPWVKAKISELESTLADQYAAASGTPAGGKTYALLIGISKYAKPDLNLQFAHADAIDFGKLLRTPRAGPVAGDDIRLLTDSNATTAAIRSAFEEFLRKKAGKADTVVILLAGHGIVEPQGDRGAYIVTYDSDPEDLKDTALGIPELQKLFQEQLQNVGRVVIFVDVCNAGTVGIIKGRNAINQQIEDQLGEAEGSLTGLLAAGPKESSYEGPEYGGGHGAFTYFVLKGLSGEADAEGNRDGIVDARELFDYVYHQVEKATTNKQHPREFGSFENRLRLADLGKPEVPVALWRTLRDFRHDDQLYLASAAQAPISGNNTEQDVERLRDAIRDGRLLADAPENATDALERLRAELAPNVFFDYQNLLRIALEDRAQRIILRYLAGDQNAQSRADFDLGSKYMAAARLLTPGSLYLEDRESFFLGRTLLFDKNFPAAVKLLEGSVRITPASAYAYNALGIGYLEQADYANAIHAFRDASRNAPYWAYPLHNVALTYTQTGDYGAAIQAYRRAMELAPRYSYLPYNLGLLYQRLNKQKEAEGSFRRAMALDPGLADAYNALGYLRESQGHASEAEQLYKNALQIDPDSLAARQNLAVMISGQRDRVNEAIALWRQNLAKQPDYLASRLSLAKALAASGQVDAAIDEYKAAERVRPDYIALRVALAELYGQKQDFEGASRELRDSLTLQPVNPLLLERLGDVEVQRGQTPVALDAYQRVLAGTIDRETRKRVRSKIRKLRH